MICPKDLVQMYQKRNESGPVGGGIANDEKYVTWTLQECPVCGRMTREYYEALLVDEDQYKKLIEKNENI